MNKVLIVLFLTVCATVYSLRLSQLFNVEKNEYGRIVLVPHPLPCEYKIVSKCFYHRRDKSGNFTSVVHVHDHYGSNRDYEDGEDSSSLVIRPDLKQPNGTIGLFQANNDPLWECLGYWLPPEVAIRYLEPETSYFTQNWTFDEREPTTFNGQKCFRYSSKDYSLALYADYDNWVIGMDFTSEAANSTCYNYFSFDVPLSAFVLDMNISTKCYAPAYKAPTERFCPSHY